MSIASDIAAALRGSTSVTEAVSGKTVTVYSGAATQDARPPFVVVSALNTDFYNTLDSDSVAVGTRMTVLDVDCKGLTEVEAGTVMNAVAAFLDDYSGGVVDAVDLSDAGDGEEAPEHGQGLPVFVKTLEAQVIHTGA